MARSPKDLPAVIEATSEIDPSPAYQPSVVQAHVFNTVSKILNDQLNAYGVQDIEGILIAKMHEHMGRKIFHQVLEDEAKKRIREMIRMLI